MKLRTVQFLNDDRGTGLVEYSVLLAFVVTIIMGLAMGYSASVSGVTSVTNANLSTASTTLR